MAHHVREVDARCDAYVDDALRLDPVEATFVGVHEHDDRWPDLTRDGFDAREQLVADARRDVEQLTPCDAREAAARDSFLERTAVQLDSCAAHEPETSLNVITSVLHGLRGAFDLMPTDGDDAWERIGTRLAALPAALDDYRTTLVSYADEDHVAPRRQIELLAEQLRSWTGQASGPSFFAGLAAGCDASAPVAQHVNSAAGDAERAFARFGAFLDDELAPRGRDTQAVGREAYARGSRYFLGARIDLDETYAWGWHELARIEQQMGDVAHEIVGSRDVDEAVRALDDDPRYTVHGKDAFRDWMQALADKTIDEMAGTHFDIPDPIRRIECCLAPTDDGGIYYTGPSEDFSRPGRMWWAVPAGVEDFSTWREVTTVYHEGVPGHHLQLGQTAYRSDLLNRWQRLLCWVSGHGEGWALYAERLMDDLGYLADPADKLGMLDAQAFRAARVVVDIGMHLELTIPADNPFGFHPGQTWTPELGLAFMRQHCRMQDEFLRFEVNRYLGWPGQAPSYKVGERIWLAARDEARARAGADFDLVTFHRQALDLGSMGLDPLREALARL